MSEREEVLVNIDGYDFIISRWAIPYFKKYAEKGLIKFQYLEKEKVIFT